jgi:hypothetical protein
MSTSTPAPALVGDPEPTPPKPCLSGGGGDDDVHPGGGPSAPLDGALETMGSHGGGPGAPPDRVLTSPENPPREIFEALLANPALGAAEAMALLGRVAFCISKPNPVRPSPRVRAFSRRSQRGWYDIAP